MVLLTIKAYEIKSGWQDDVSSFEVCSNSHERAITGGIYNKRKEFFMFVQIVNAFTIT